MVHGGYLVSQGDTVRQVLLRLKGTLDRRGQSWERLVRLKGRLEILRAVKEGRGVGGREPEVRWVEDEEESEGEVEDVRYLTGGDDEEEEEEVGVEDVEMEDIDMMNGVDESEEGEEDEEEAEESEASDEDDREEVKPKKVNGVPHFSDSEDSAVDLEDLIDDEASEASDEEEEDDDEEEEEEDEDEDEEDIPPPKKSKSRR